MYFIIRYSLNYIITSYILLISIDKLLRISLNYIVINICNSINSQCNQIAQIVNKLYCRFIQISDYPIRFMITILVKNYH